MTLTGLLLLIAGIALGVWLFANLFISKPDGIFGWIYNYLRYFLAVFFLFSGAVKAIDAKGTGYKLVDYFGVFGEYAPFLDGLWNFGIENALAIAFFTIVLELFLGFTLLFGVFKKLTLFLYAGLLVFFTFLTGFTTRTGKVTDCGCFGDFLKIEPFQSFQKDLLLVAIFIVILLFAKKYLKPMFKSSALGYGLVVLLTAATIWFSYYNITHLPIKDFRPYAIGTDLNKCTNMEGLDPGEKQIFYQMVNTNGEKKEMESKEYMSSQIWKDKSWKIEGEPREVVIRKAELPKCKDFEIETANGELIQEDIMSNPNYNFLVTAYNLDKSSDEGFEMMNKLTSQLKQKGYELNGLTGSNIATANAKSNNTVSFNNLDAIPIKTMIRANPGIILVKDGIIKGKWHYNDLPTIEDLNKEFGI